MFTALDKFLFGISNRPNIKKDLFSSKMSSRRVASDPRRGKIETFWKPRFNLIKLFNMYV